MGTAPAEVAERIGFRPAVDRDRDFVQATLLNHYYEESFWAQRLTTRTYFNGHTPFVQTLLDRAKVLVACEVEDQDALLGFIIFEPSDIYGNPTVLDFLYVKKSWRDLGIGKMLFRAFREATGAPEDLAGVEVSFATKAWFTTKARLGIEARFKATYNPYLQYRGMIL